MSLQLLGDDRPLRRRALFSSVSHLARDAERDHATRWFSGQRLFAWKPKAIGMMREGDQLFIDLNELLAGTQVNPAAGVSGEVPPPGQTGVGEG